VSHRQVRIPLVAAFAAFTSFVSAVKTPAGTDWPQWRGPDRTNVSTETGLLKEWPAGGPPLAWKVAGLGQGVPSVAAAGGRVFVLGESGGQEVLTALSEADGKSVWSVAVGRPPGGMPLMRWLSQRTPTVDGDRVYAFTAHGELTCLATADGKQLWQKDYDRDFGGQRGQWGYCDFPLVDGDRLICTPGGQTMLVALDKKSGKVIWKSDGGSRSAYGGVVRAEICGVRQYVHQVDGGIFGVAAADGKLLWEYYPPRIAGANVHTALVRGDEVFASWGWQGAGAALLKLSRGDSGFKVQEVYHTNCDFDAYLGSSVRLGEYVHVANGLCIEWKTGRLVHQTAPPPPASGKASKSGKASVMARIVRMTMTAADGRLYHRTGNNLMTLSEVAADGTYVKRGEFTAPHGGEPTWTFPVIANGRLYLRDQDALFCYDIRDRAATRERQDRRRRPDVIFVPTPQDVVEKMLELAKITRDDVVADLGCGDGRFVVTAAKKYGCKAYGCDLDKECVRQSLENVKTAGVEKLVQIEEKDIFLVDLQKFTVVMLYLGPTMNSRLIPQLEKMNPGSRIVSHGFPTPGLIPDNVETFVSSEDDISRKLYLWTTPVKKEPKKD
jgi:outer membrane protein assembly factor BamB